jgi:hypothetical protein
MMMEVNADAGWTCKYGRAREHLQYASDPELAGAVTSLHDMTCTVKQGAYLNLQRAKLKLSGVDSEAIAYTSLQSMPGFVHSAQPNATAAATAPNGALRKRPSQSENARDEAPALSMIKKLRLHDGPREGQSGVKPRAHAAGGTGNGARVNPVAKHKTQPKPGARGLEPSAKN